MGSIGIPHVDRVSLPRIPQLQKGGEVLRTGVAVVHRGEAIGQPVTVNIGTVNLDAGVTREDVARLVDTIEGEMRSWRRRGL